MASCLELQRPFIEEVPPPTRWRRRPLLVITFLAIFLTILAKMLRMHENVQGDIREGKYIVQTEHAIVATDDELCSQIGKDVLLRKGHAIDATVAVALCLGVVHPMSSGIGGGSFMVLRLANGQEEAYDFRECAPAAATEDLYEKDPSLKSTGALSVGVPGELAGLFTAWKKYGRIPWKELFEPAISLAKDGFEISWALSSAIQMSSKSILTDQGLKETFAPNGKLLKTGDICIQKKLAASLKAIAESGPGIFYNGIIGEKLVKDLKEAGGIMTINDLRDYQVEAVKPITAEVLGYKILGMPPPSSGGPGLIMILNILASIGSPLALANSLGLHRFIEATKHMFAVRMNLGDPKFVNDIGVVADMVSPQFASELRISIFDNMTFSPSHYGGKWSQLRDHGTSHFSIVDVERNAVAMTSSVNAYFGAKILSKSTGIVLNNEMDDFSVATENSTDQLPPSVENYIQPKKRPLSSMSPTIILQHGQLKGIIGASGGSMIIPAVAQVYLNIFVQGLDPLLAVASARAYHQLVPNVVKFENWTTGDGKHFELCQKLIRGLEKRGHTVETTTSITATQVIVQDLSSPVDIQPHITPQKGVFYGKLTAVSDPRKGGQPAGF